MIIYKMEPVDGSKVTGLQQVYRVEYYGYTKDVVSKIPIGQPLPYEEAKREVSRRSNEERQT